MVLKFLVINRSHVLGGVFGCTGNDYAGAALIIEGTHDSILSTVL